jgi:hypothetical protein
MALELERQIMTIPTIQDIHRHCFLGGLWRIIPAQGPPLFAVLGIAGNMCTYNGGDLASTVEDSNVLKGADWVPVDRRGDRI